MFNVLETSPSHMFRLVLALCVLIPASAAAQSGRTTVGTNRSTDELANSNNISFNAVVINHEEQYVDSWGDQHVVDIWVRNVHGLLREAVDERAWETRFSLGVEDDGSGTVEVQKGPEGKGLLIWVGGTALRGGTKISVSGTCEQFQKGDGVSLVLGDGSAFKLSRFEPAGGRRWLTC